LKRSMPSQDDQEYSTNAGTQQRLNNEQKRRIRKKLAIKSKIPLEREYGMVASKPHRTLEESHIATWDHTGDALHKNLKDAGAALREKQGEPSNAALPKSKRDEQVIKKLKQLRTMADDLLIFMGA